MILIQKGHKLIHLYLNYDRVGGRDDWIISKKVRTASE